MMVIIEFRVKFSEKSRIREYWLTFLIYMSCLRKKTYLHNYKEEIEVLNTKVTKSHSILSLNHKLIVT